jgi:predicted alpha/beta-hydrolase family hydrolase
MTREQPGRYIDTMSKRDRKGRIFIDYFRNERGATAVAAYSTRASARATVSTPLDWDELSEGLRSNHFTVDNVRHRLAVLRDDPWADFFKLKQKIPMPERVRVEVGADATTAIVYAAAAKPAGVSLILAHGAGADQSHPFMVGFASELAARGVETITFNFLYTEQKRRVPDPAAKLEACYRQVVAAFRQGRRLVIGGKSMGGRMASHLAAAGETPIAGLLLLGYPLHPPGQPNKLRIDHLERISVPTLIVQGARDAFGTPDEVRPYLKRFQGPVELYPVAHGDHSFKVPKRAASQDDTDRVVLDHVERWLRAL